MFCTKCGLELDSDDKFCPKCGTKVVSYEKEVPKSVERQENSCTEQKTIEVSDKIVNKPRKDKSIIKRLLFLVFILLTVWVYRHFDEITGYRFKEKAFNDSIKVRLLSHESSLIEKYAEEQHRNDPNYTFDIEEAEKNAETDISKVLQDQTKYILHEREMNRNMNDSYAWAREYEIIKAYSVINFKGDIVLDLEELGDSFKEKKSVILIGPDISTIAPKKCTYKVEDGKVIVDYEIEQLMSSYLIVVANENSFIANAKAKVSYLGENLEYAFNNTFTLPDVDNGNFLVRNYFLERVFRNKPLMIMVSSGDETTDAMLKQYCVDSAIHFVEADIKGSNMTITEKDIKVVSKAEFYFRYKLLKVLFPKDEQIPYVEGYYDNSPHSKSYNNKYRNLYFVGYYTFSDLENTIGRTIARNNKNTSLFSSEDIFHFRNFCSKTSYGGNCAGIAYYTMKLFNDGTVPSSGSSDFDSWSSYKTAKLGGNRGVVEWDISKDEENAELLTRYINGYNPNFVNDHTAEFKITHSDGTEELVKLAESYLSPYEEEFSKMIGSYWFEVNKTTNESKCRKDFGDYWDYGLIEDILDIIDDNRIVQIGFNYPVKDEDGEHTEAHSVNAYHYEIIDDNNIDLYIYDSNYPNDYVLSEVNFKSWEKTYKYDLEHDCFDLHDLHKAFCIMHIKKKIINGKEVFLYDYNLVPNGEIVATNDKNLLDTETSSYLFVVNDEDMNILNNKYKN